MLAIYNCLSTKRSATTPLFPLRYGRHGLIYFVAGDSKMNDIDFAPDASYLSPWRP